MGLYLSDAQAAEVFGEEAALKIQAPSNAREVKQKSFIDSLNRFAERADPEVLGWLSSIKIELDEHGRATLQAVWNA
jgi:hypothetical protein